MMKVRNQIMYCPKCGAEIREGEQFCGKCGTKVRTDNKASDKGTSSGPKMPKNIRIPDMGNLKRFLPAVVVVVVVIIIAAAFMMTRKTTINLNKFVTEPEYTGYDGFGGISGGGFDGDAYRNKYDGKIQYTEKASGNYDIALEIAFGYSAADALREEYINGRLQADPNLSNGDTVTFVWNISDEDVKAARQYFNVNLKFSDITYTVRGLEDIERVDAFDGVRVEFSGVSPDASASIIVSGQYPDSFFALDQTSGLALGDVVTVSVTDNGLSSMENMGVAPKEMSMELTVDGVPVYADDLSSIPDDLMGQMESIGEEELYAGTTGWSEGAAITDKKCLGEYFLTRNGSGDPQNMLYLVYRVDATVPEDAPESTVEYYWYCRFDNILVEEDGSYSADLENYSGTEGGVYYWGGFYGNYVTVGRYAYTGFESLDSLFANCVSKNADNYSYQTNIG